MMVSYWTNSIRNIMMPDKRWKTSKFETQTLSGTNLAPTLSLKVLCDRRGELTQSDSANQ